MNFPELANALKSSLPTGVHRRVNEILRTLEKTFEKGEDKGIFLILQPLEQLVKKLQNGMIKPIPAMRKLQNLEKWADLFLNAFQKNEISPADINGAAEVNDLWLTFMGQVSSGRSVNITDILKRSKIRSEPEVESQYKDITSANLIVTLGEILDDIEQSFDQDMPGVKQLLISGEYDKIDPSCYQIESDWAKNQIENENATRINIRNLILEKRKEFARSLEIYKIFKPIYKEVHTIITLMPILLTMMTENRDGIEEIKKDCNNIFMELSVGHQLERITLSLKEKVGKHRDVEDIRINAKAIQKTLEKIKDALNFRVFSFLRRLNVKTIIEESIFQNAQEIGLDLTGLNSKFGIQQAPEYYKDIVMETTRIFSHSVMKYKKLVAPRLPEEFHKEIKPNLRTTYRLVSDIEGNIGKYYMIVPAHIGPIYSKTVSTCAKKIDQIARFLTPLKEKMLKQVVYDENSKDDFYGELERLHKELAYSYDIFNDFFDLGLTLANIDQELALAFCKNATDKSYFENAYESLIRNSTTRVKRMLAMKTLSRNTAKQILKKLKLAEEKFKNFTTKRTFDEISSILDQNEEI